MKKALAKNIQYYRKQNSYTQESLADIFNCTRATISSWETGVNTPDIFTLIQLSKLFNITLNDLLDDLISDDKNQTIDSDKKKRIILLTKKIEKLSESELDSIEFALKLIEHCHKKSV